jgi:signal transduction protein with GAF and PtsI domain
MTLLDTVSSASSAAEALAAIIRRFGADSGTVHFLGPDGVLHLAAAEGLPATMLPIIRDIPVGKGMAGLAVERRRPVDACNIQTDASGDVRLGAKATGLEGAIVVPIFRGEDVAGALGIANRRERTFSAEEQDELVAAGRILAKLR